MGDSVLAAVLEASEDERKLPSLSAVSLSETMVGSRDMSKGWETLPGPPMLDRGVWHSRGLLDLVEAMNDVGRDLGAPVDDRST
jgi:hypothetical protein